VNSFGAHLLLSANPESVGRALAAGVAAATILPSKAPQSASDQLRIAFDGDAVIFGDESERVSQEQGIEAFHRNEVEHADTPLSGGPFRGFLAALHNLQAAFPAGDAAPIRTALVTARSAPAHKRVILTLRSWGVRLDEALFLGGRDKGPFLQAFGADIFFDDSHHNVENARRHVATGHVPHGVAND
jgi:5'-nucleotidase